MNNSNLSIAKAYYNAMAAKDLTAMEKYLHSDVKLIAPFAEGIGKKAVLEAVTKATSLFNTLSIRAKFSSDDQAILVYDVNFPAPIGKIASAVLMTFQDKLILKIELFYDARQIEKTWKNSQ